MTARPMTEGEVEALFDKAVDALREVYGAPMAASILDGRARLITKEANDLLGWPSPAAIHPICATEERCAFEVWAHADHRRLEPEEYEERTPDNNHYYADDSTNQAYIGWCAALLSTSSAERERLLCGECGTITRNRQCHCTEAGEEPHWFNYTDWLSSEVVRLDAAVRGMREAAQSVIEQAQTSVTDHEGRQHAMVDDRGEVLYLVQFEAIEQLRAALSLVEGEDKQATRGDDAATAPTTTDTKDTTK